MKSVTHLTKREELEIILDSVPASIFYKDKENRFIRVNKAFADLMKIPKKLLEGKSCVDLYPKDQAEAFWKDDLEVINSDKPKRNIIESMTAEDKLMWIQTDKIPYCDASGNCIGIIGFTLDITEKKNVEDELIKSRYHLEESVKERTKELEKEITERKLIENNLRESEEKFRNIFEFSPLGKVMISMDGSRKINAEFCEILGYSEEELKNKNWDEITYPDDIQANIDTAQSLLKGDQELARSERRYIHKNGKIVWTDIITTLLKDLEGKPQFLIMTINDITERKASEKALQKSLVDLKRSNEELEQFAYIASHDLQEPLRMVSSYTQLLEKRYSDKLDQDAREFINYAVDGANRMQFLINDLLQFSRITTQGKEFKEIDAFSILGQAVNNLQFKIESNNAIVTNDDLPVIKADEIQIVRLLQNLIDNALKFKGTESPRVHISCQSDKEHWLFSVKDNGIGIDPKYQERIFQIFQRLSRGGEYPGTGIGLAICKRIVERHGGKIWVESESGKGATFLFTIKK